MITTEEVIHVIDDIGAIYNDKYIAHNKILNIYVSKDFKILLRSILIYSYMNFIYDEDRKDLEYGFIRKSKIIANTNEFFYG